MVKQPGILKEDQSQQSSCLEVTKFKVNYDSQFQQVMIMNSDAKLIEKKPPEILN